MDTQHQITQYLVDKKLPLDILLEVQDHMMDQVNNLVSDKGISEESALQEVKDVWSKDLKLEINFLPFSLRKQAHLVNQIARRNYLRILSKSLMILLGIFAVSTLVTLYLPTMAISFFTFLYAIIGAFGLSVAFIERKLIKTTKRDYPQNISVYQRMKGNMLLIGSFYVLLVNLWNVGSGSNKLSVIYGINTLFSGQPIKSAVLLNIVFSFFYVNLMIYGYLYLRNYKKAVAKIRERIPLSL